MSASDSATAPAAGGVLGGAGLAGVLLGLTDTLGVELASTLAPGPGRVALLALLDVVLSVGLCLLPALVALVLPGALRRRLLGPSGPWAGLLLGLAWGVLLDLGVWWFTDPPPFSEAPPLLGNPVIFGFMALCMVGLLLGLARLRGEAARALALGAVLVGLLVEAGLQARSLPPRGAATDHPNLLLVSLDTTRADHFGAYGAGEGRTPAFDALAEEGLLFTRAMAPIPVTGPSHTTLLSGVGPWTHGNLLNGLPVPEGLPLLPEHLRARGYRTGAFVSAYVLEGDLGFARGFEVYDDHFAWLQGWSHTLPGRLQAALGRLQDPDHVLERRGEHTVDEALAWLDEAAGQEAPWFAWVHLFDPHGPYEPPPPWDTAFYEGDPRDPAHDSMAQVTGVAPYLEPSLAGITDVDWVLAQYQGEVSYADAQVGRLRAFLEERGLAEETLVVVVADHGESLGEHGVWFNHGDDLFEPSVHVPLVLWRPGHIPAGAVAESPVELGDLAPTVLSHLGLEALPGAEGLDLLGSLHGGPTRPFARSIAFDREANLEARRAGEITRPTWRMVALRGPSSRYVYRDDPDRGGAAFYDLSAPAGETAEAPLDQELAGLLRAAARETLDRMSAEDMARSATELDDETRKRLEQLGYLDG